MTARRHAAVEQSPFAVGESPRLRELAEGLVRLGFSQTVSRQRINAAYDALAGQSATDEAIVLQALKNR